MTRPMRVRTPYVERMATTLSARDWAIIMSVYRVQLATGQQLERLHFQDLDTRSKNVMRWRVLKRLVDARVLVTLTRRIGTARCGSAAQRYALDSAGQRLIQLRLNAEAPGSLVRRPRLPGNRFVAHTLAVTELYVALVEQSRLGSFALDAFDAEPAAWAQNGLGGWLKPDAYVRLSRAGEHFYWWYEADLATESVPTIRRKLLVYLDFVQRGQLGPDGMVPWVLIGVPNEVRQTVIQTVINQLGELASYLFRVATFGDVVTTITQELIR